jgi:hypothetical protein
MKYVFIIVSLVTALSFLTNEENDLKIKCHKEGGVMIQSDFGCKK